MNQGSDETSHDETSAVARLPFLPEYESNRARSVCIPQARHELQRTAQSFLSELAAALPPGKEVAVPSVQHLTLPHPIDQFTYAQLRIRSQGGHLQDTPDAEQQQREQAEIEHFTARWAAACEDLQTLPRDGHPGYRHAPFRDASTPSAPSPQLVLRAREALTEAPALLQMALHCPFDAYRLTHIVLATAEHSLADVHDVLQCPNDKHAEAELGVRPVGGLFFIEGTLYEDTRHTQAPGYAEPVVDFLRVQGKEAAQRELNVLRQKMSDFSLSAVEPEVPRVEPMQHTRLGDLHLKTGRLGEYVYVHAGACEHMLTVQDVRYAHSSDVAVTDRPVVVFQASGSSKRLCCTCRTSAADKVAFRDVLAPTSPAFFCRPCFDSLHRDESGILKAQVAGATFFSIC